MKNREVRGLAKAEVDEMYIRSAQNNTSSHDRNREFRKLTRSGSWEPRA